MGGAREFVLEREQWIGRPIDEVFAFFGDATNLERITPPWLGFSILSPTPIDMHAGTLIDYRLRWHGLPIRWRTLIEAWEPPLRFIDTQVLGPYPLWHHTHVFEEEAGGTRIRDIVRYRLPLGPIGRLAHRLGVRRDLEAVFVYRTLRIAEHFGGPSQVGPATAMG